MLCYVLCCFLLLILMVLAALVIIFLMLCLGTGDLVLDYLCLSNLLLMLEMLASTCTMLGLDQLLYVQYGTWLWKALHLDFGISFASQRLVLDDMLNFLPAMLELAGVALVLILLTSVLLGIWVACHCDCLLDFAVCFIVFLGVLMPNFWLVFLLVMVFLVYLQWLPVMGYGGWQHIILPVVSIAFMLLVINVCLLRASMLDVAGQCHVTWACLRGLNDKQTECCHILCNALLLMITAVGMHIGELIGGMMIIENIFAWLGVGCYVVLVIFNCDYLVIQCFMLMMVVVFVVCNLIVDLLNAVLDLCICCHEGVHV